ncbi:hypothetical protein BG006_004965 [Podila minutissima]|uniref:Uncharacterized protein n=1 Tax=Podila minutissima TaxID=64525 RepID=A0A9P5SNL4_9FUNG|nr:hypothetical protein BG006_004965 [Podila minutissima]
MLIYDRATLPFDDMTNTEMEGAKDDNVVKAPLNMDVPKTTRHADGQLIMTVLNYEHVHVAIRVQYCVCADSPSKAHLVKRLKSMQVIGYESQQVEMSQRIGGKKLLAQGGVTVHLDPVLVTLGLTLRTVPDEKLPLQKQQHAAYCCRNIKEMYLDNASKDVAIYIMKPLHDQEQRRRDDLGPEGCLNISSRTRVLLRRLLRLSILLPAHLLPAPVAPTLLHLPQKTKLFQKTRRRLRLQSSESFMPTL